MNKLFPEVHCLLKRISKVETGNEGSFPTVLYYPDNQGWFEGRACPTAGTRQAGLTFNPQAAGMSVQGVRASLVRHPEREDH
jgi:hypothetical protein